MKLIWNHLFITDVSNFLISTWLDPLSVEGWKFPSQDHLKNPTPPLLLENNFWQTSFFALKLYFCKKKRWKLKVSTRVYPITLLMLSYDLEMFQPKTLKGRLTKLVCLWSTCFPVPYPFKLTTKDPNLILTLKLICIWRKIHGKRMSNKKVIKKHLFKNFPKKNSFFRDVFLC